MTPVNHYADLRRVGLLNIIELIKRPSVSAISSAWRGYRNKT
jgi:hypothetical protein